MISLTCDGAASNRSFFKLHSDVEDMQHGVVYRTKNIYAPDGRYVYFLSDVPHLMKTVRNCWLGSRVNGPRYMQVIYTSNILTNAINIYIITTCTDVEKWKVHTVGTITSCLPEDSH